MKESRITEFKENVNNSFLKTVSAYANFNGGKIIFGVKDDSTEIGLKDIKKTKLEIENKINDTIRPKPDYSFSENSTKKTLTLLVKEGKNKPYFYNSKAYKRNDTSTIEMDIEELKHFILNSNNTSYDELEISNNTLRFTILENKLIEALRIKKLNDETLKTLGLLSADGKYNFAASLLSDTSDHFGVDCVRFGDTIDIFKDRLTITNKSILSQFYEVQQMYRKYYQYEKIKGVKRILIEQIPEIAFREALINAIIHRDYSIDANIKISMFDDRIEIISPGGLPKNLTKEHYLKGDLSILRNKTIANVFQRLHYIEGFGTGIQRIIACYKNNYKKPIFNIYDTLISITLPIIDETPNLNDSELKVYNAIKSKGMASSSEIVKITHFGKSKVVVILNMLVKDGYIKIIGIGRGTKYTI